MSPRGGDRSLKRLQSSPKPPTLDTDDDGTENNTIKRFKWLEEGAPPAEQATSSSPTPPAQPSQQPIEIDADDEVCASAVGSSSTDGGNVASGPAPAPHTDVAHDGDLSAVEQKLNTIAFDVRKEEGAEPDTPLLRAFWQAASTGDVNPRSQIGQRFNREIANDAELKAMYNRDRTYEAKKAFRARWATQRFKMLEESRVYACQWKNIDRNKGEYMVLERVIEQYGYSVDAAKARTAGINYAHSCARMGGRWVLWEPMSKTYQFLYLRREWITLRDESWTMYEKSTEPDHSPTEPKAQRQQPSAPPAANEAAPLEDKKGSPAKAQAKRAAKPKSAGAASGAAPEGSPRQPPAEQQQLDASIKSGINIRSQYNYACTISQNMIQMIESDSAWGWAKNDQNIGHIQRLHALMQKEIGRDLMAVLVAEPKTWKTEFGASFLSTQLERLQGHVKGHIESLGGKWKLLRAMHKSATAK